MKVTVQVDAMAGAGHADGLHDVKLEAKDRRELDKILRKKMTRRNGVRAYAIVEQDGKEVKEGWVKAR